MLEPRIAVVDQHNSGALSPDRLKDRLAALDAVVRNSVDVFGLVIAFRTCNEPVSYPHFFLAFFIC